MMKTSKTFIYIVGFMALFTALPAFAAPGDLNVVFENTPLFSEANFLPGEEVMRSVQVGNNSSSTKTIQAEAVNVINTLGLGDAINLRITEGILEHFNGTFTDFFNTGEVVLSDVVVDATTTYQFTAVFTPESDNTYQEATMGFDLIVGFWDGVAAESFSAGNNEALFSLSSTETSGNNLPPDTDPPIRSIRETRIQPILRNVYESLSSLFETLQRLSRFSPFG